MEKMNDNKRVQISHNWQIHMARNDPWPQIGNHYDRASEAKDSQAAEGGVEPCDSVIVLQAWT